MSTGNYHRYLNFFGAQDLAQGCLNVANVAHFNDPFEWQYAAIDELSDDDVDQLAKKMKTRSQEKGHPAGQKSLEFFRERVKETALTALVQSRPELFEQLAQKFRVLCLATPDNDPQIDRRQQVFMWGYYADGYKGIRLHFHEDFYEWPIWQDQFAVDYYQHPQRHSASTLLDPKRNENFWMTLMRSKGDPWKFENEYRLLMYAEDADEHRPCSDKRERSYIKIDASRALARIDLGIRFFENPSAAEVLAKIERIFPDTEIFQSVPCYDTFSVLYQPR